MRSRCSRGRQGEGGRRDRVQARWWSARTRLFWEGARQVHVAVDETEPTDFWFEKHLIVQASSLTWTRLVQSPALLVVRPSWL